MPRAKVNRRSSSLGNAWQLKGGRWAAKYERFGQTHRPGRTFPTFALADLWLRQEQDLIDRDQWTPPAERREAAQAAAEAQKLDATSLRDFGRSYIDTRRVRGGAPLAPRTRSEYAAYLDGILGDLAERPVASLTPEDVDAWWTAHGDVPRLRHHAYALLKQLCAHAMTRAGGELLTRNPCEVAGASFVNRREAEAVRDQRIMDLTPTGVELLSDTVTARHRALVLVLAWTALRPGEALALRRSDITRTDRDGVPCWRLGVRQAATTDRDENGKAVRVLDRTKTAGSVRDVHIPPHLVPALEQHLDQWAGPGAHGLVFPSAADPAKVATIQQLWGTSPSSGRPASGFHAARLVVNLPDLTVYDLRRWGRLMLRRAGMSDLDVEQYMGHALNRVQGAYAVLDPAQVWPVMLRASELAGWQPPAQTPALPIPARLLDAMTTEQLSAALGAMSEVDLAAVTPHLAPETLTRALLAGTKPPLTERRIDA